MSWLSRQFERRAGGSAMGNMWRRAVTTIADNFTMGMASAVADKDQNGMMDFLEVRQKEFVQR